MNIGNILWKLLFIALIINGIAWFTNFIVSLELRIQEQKIEYLKKDIENLELRKELLERPVIKETVYVGMASYYSVDGCVGCRDDQLMANGQKFDENAMTLAFNWLPLGTDVEVYNPSTGEKVIAEITDTGGFNKLGRIADLSKGTKDAIGCTDLCKVEIKEINK